MTRRLAALALILLLAACGGVAVPTPGPTMFQSVLMLPVIANNAVGLNRLKGLGIDTGWNDDTSILTYNCGDAGKVGASWWHNWRVTNLDCPLGGFIPTVYNTDTLGSQALATTSGPILGFNEPDISEQANI